MIAALVWWQKALALAGGLIWLGFCLLAMREAWRAFAARADARKRDEEREPRWHP